MSRWVDAGGQLIVGADAHIKAQLPRISMTVTHIAAGSVPLVVNVYTPGLAALYISLGFKPTNEMRWTPTGRWSPRIHVTSVVRA